MLPFNPILAAAMADLVVGMFWYSDYAFGPMWRKITGEKTEMKKDFYIRIIFQIVSSIMIASAFFIAVSTFQKHEMVQSQEFFTRFYSWFFTPAIEGAELGAALKIAGFMWLGFFVPANLSCAVWHTNIMWEKFFIKSGCRLAQFALMAIALVMHR